MDLSYREILIGILAVIFAWWFVATAIEYGVEHGIPKALRKDRENQTAEAEREESLAREKQKLGID